jgi:hypothetical protein
MGILYEAAGGEQLIDEKSERIMSGISDVGMLEEFN